MEILSLNEMEEKEEKLEHETIDEAYKDENVLTFFDALEHLSKHMYDFSVFHNGDGTKNLYVDRTDCEFCFVFDKHDKCVDKSIHYYHA